MEDPQVSGTGELEAIVAEFAEKGLAQYLADADLAKQVTGWLAEETGLPRAALNIAVKALATLVERAGKEGAKWLGNAAAERCKQILVAVPGYERLMAALRGLLNRFSKELLSKSEFQEVLAGRRPAADAKYSDDLSLDFQAHLRQLRNDEALARQLGDGFRTTVAALGHIEERLNPQPPLHLKPQAQRQANRFVFRAQVAPFVGRESELATLEAFLGAEQKFLWWLIVGPGGQDKSRLAFELCLRHAAAWRVGFLQPADFAWHEWRPERPTLIIADYASRDPERLRQAALAVAAQGQLDFPVRLLLIERDPKGSWYSQFEGGGSARHDLIEARYREPLLLEFLNDEALWHVMLAFFARTGAIPPDRDSTLAKLKQIDASPIYSPGTYIEC